MSGIIDGRGWVRERIAHLEAALDGGDLDDGQRAAVEEELGRLRQQDQQTTRRRRWWWVFGGPTP